MREKKVWKEILNEILKNSPSTYCGPFDIDEHSLAKKLNINGRKLSETTQFLEKHGLIELKKNFSKNKIWQYNELILTEKGFNITLKNQEEKREEKRINQQIYLTGALFTLAFLQATISIIYYFFDLQLRQSPSSSIFLVSSVIATILFFIISSTSNPFS